MITRLVAWVLLIPLILLVTLLGGGFFGAALILLAGMFSILSVEFRRWAIVQPPFCWFVNRISGFTEETRYGFVILIVLLLLPPTLVGWLLTTWFTNLVSIAVLAILLVVAASVVLYYLTHLSSRQKRTAQAAGSGNSSNTFPVEAVVSTLKRKRTAAVVFVVAVVSPSFSCAGSLWVSSVWATSRTNEVPVFVETLPNEVAAPQAEPIWTVESSTSTTLPTIDVAATPLPLPTGRVVADSKATFVSTKADENKPIEATIPDETAMLIAQPTTPSSAVIVGVAAVSNVDANLRSSPSLGSVVIGSVAAGTTVTVTGQSDDGVWFQLEQGAWIYAALVDASPIEISAALSDTAVADTIEPSQRSTDLDIPSLIGASLEDIDSQFGPTNTVFPRDAGEIRELPAGGETRVYRIGQYGVWINFNKEGTAQGVQLTDGLFEYGFQLVDWEILFPLVGLTTTREPDIVEPKSLAWHPYRELQIRIQAQGSDGIISYLKVYQP